MIVIHGAMDVLPEWVDEVDRRGAEFAARSRAEDACIDYRLSWAAGSPHSLCLVEVWKSMAAYKAHTATEHVAAWAAWIPQAAAGPIRTTRHQVEPVGTQVF